MEKSYQKRNRGVEEKETKDNAVIIIIAYSEKELKKGERVFVFL